MLRRLDDLDDGAVVNADVVIIGAGAAGISLGLGLARSPLRVLLLEAGDLDLDAETQDLYDGEVIGLPYEPLISSRLRYLGGTTNHWTGWCKPLDAIDLAARPEIGAQGWPIGLDAIRPYYDRAQELCQVGPFLYDERLWAEIGIELEAPPADRLRHAFWERSPPTKFGQRYLAELTSQPNLEVLLGANVVDIESNETAAHVTGVQLRSIRGRKARAVGSTYVLAAGGIENPRLLLASNRVQKEGLGNGRDLVGRYFMEHPHWRVATVATEAPYPLIDRYYRRQFRGLVHRVGWSLAEPAQRAAACRNCSLEIDPDIEKIDGAETVSDLAQQVLAGRIPDRLGERMYTVLTDLDEVAVGAWRKYVEGAYVNTPVGTIHLMVTLDPAPNPDSRVKLGTELDALGMPRAQLDWRLSDLDAHSVATLTTAVGAEITRLGLGRVRLHRALEDAASAWVHAGNLVGHDVDPALPEMSISWHNMGTTKMGADASGSVVDGDCRVHGIDNLFIAGSSVFPYTGNANPTLTIVAMALRLADHLGRLSPA